MFRNHNPKINNFAQRNPDNLFLVIMMVVLSIQQKWSLVGDMMSDIKVDKLQSKYIWGNKVKSYVYLSTHKHMLYSRMMAVLNSNKDDFGKSHSLMHMFLKVEGLGLAKAGFVCQLVAGLVGWMDVHNIKTYGVDPNLLKYNKKLKTRKSIAANNKKVVDYIDLCDQYGAENLWNSWCSMIADKYPQDFVDGYHVSELHYTYLID